MKEKTTNGSVTLKPCPLHSFSQDDADITNRCSLLEHYLRCVHSVEWKWFATLTFDPKNTDGFSSLFCRFSNWLKYQRLTTGKKIPYLLVFEPSEKHGWHIHGLFDSDIDDSLVSFAELDQRGFLTPRGNVLPRTFVSEGYYDWPAFREHFGFCSLAEIGDLESTAYYLFDIILSSLPTRGKALYRPTFYYSGLYDSSKEVSSGG